MHRSLSRWKWLPVVAASLVALPAHAEEAKASSGEAGKGEAAPAKPSGDVGSSGKSDGGSSSGDAPKPSAPTGGYSWTEKPHRSGHRRKHKATDPVARFPSFRMLGNGTSEITVFVSRKVNVQVRKVAGRVAFVLDGADVPVWNNTHALVTTHFDTPAARSRLAPSKEGAQLIIELRESVDVAHKLVDGPRGSVTLVVTLPASKRKYSKLDDELDSDAKAKRDRPAKSGETRSTRRRGPNP